MNTNDLQQETSNTKGAFLVTANLLRRNRLPVVLQTSRVDCGIACLAMIAAFHGRRTSLIELRQRFPPSVRGTKISELITISEKLGLSARALKVPVAQIGDIKLPALLVFSNSHYVVLKSVKKGVATIHDPASGIRKLSEDDFHSNFSNVAIEFVKSPHWNNENNEKNPRVRLTEFWKRIDGVWKFMLQMLVLSVAFQIFAIVFPIANQIVVDEVIGAGNSSLLNVLMVAFSLVLIIQIILQLLRSFIGAYFNSLLSYAMSANVTQHLLSLPLKYFSGRGIGDITIRYQSLGPIQGFLTTTFISALMNIISVVFTGIFMVYYAPMLSIITMLSVLIYIVIRVAYFPHIRRLAEKQMVSAGEAQNDFAENVRSIYSVKTSGTEASRLEAWKNKYLEFLQDSFDMIKFTNFGQAGDTLLKGVHTLSVLYVGATLIIDEQMTLGMLMAYQSYRSQFSTAAIGLVGTVFSYFMINLHLERVSDILLTESEQEPSKVKRSLPDVFEYEIKDASFRYDQDGDWIFKDVNLWLGQTDRLALTGPSGVGKTTFLRLLIGLERVSTGEIYLGGSPLLDHDLQMLRRSIGTVMREDRLFAGNIIENIALGDSTPDYARAIDCAKAAEIHDEISQFPMQYLSPVSEITSGLSAGQLQRVLIARALYKQPKLILMDEATANLHEVLEERIFANLSELRIPQIWVSHRITPLKYATKVYELVDGELKLSKSNN